MKPVGISKGRNENVLAALRIGVGIFFLVFGEYKVFGTQFTLGGGFQNWINRFIAHGAYPLTRNVALLATFRNITGIYGQNYQFFAPSLGAPSVAGLPPSPLYGLPYGPPMYTNSTDGLP